MHVNLETLTENLPKIELRRKNETLKIQKLSSVKKQKTEEKRFLLFPLSGKFKSSKIHSKGSNEMTNNQEKTGEN